MGRLAASQVGVWARLVPTLGAKGFEYISRPLGLQWPVRLAASLQGEEALVNDGWRNNFKISPTVKPAVWTSETLTNR